MTEQVTRIIRRAKKCECVRYAYSPNVEMLDKSPVLGWLLYVISDHEAYWIHTKTDFVVPSARNY